MLYKNEIQFVNKFKYIAGVDEAGRGPLAGPVVIAAVILDNKHPIAGLDDSKKLSAKKRDFLYNLITVKSVCYNIQIVSPQKIDEINILQATLHGMEEAVLNMKVAPEFCLIDGNQTPKRIANFSQTFVKGDRRFASIAAASILAKVTRDRIMQKYHKKFPQYNFKQNKGYPTKEHISAIRRVGITPIHRKSYKPVSELTFDFSI